MKKNVAGAALSGAALALSVSSCSGGGAVGMTPRSGSPIVAADGATASSVRRAIADAETHGQAARYITVVTANNRYVFSPHDLVMKSKNGILVEAYSKLYVYPLHGTTILYSGSSGPVSLDTIPAVTVDALDAQLALVGAAAARLPVPHDTCADCAVVLTGRKANSASNDWGGLQDPWQVHPDYQAPTKWAEESSSDRPAVAAAKTTKYEQAAPVYIQLPYGQYLYSYNYHGSGGNYVGVQPPAPPCVPVIDTPGTVATLVNGNAKVAALAGKIANYNATVQANGGNKLANINITYGPVNGNGDAAASAYVDYSNPQNDNLTWDAAAVALAVSNGQDATQILFHELDHFLNGLTDPTTGTGRRVPLPASGTRPADDGFPANGMASVSIGGSTFTYNLNVPAQFLAYEHAIVHNDLIAAFPVGDKTGALQSAVQGIPRKDANGTTQTTLDAAGAAGFAKTNAANVAAASIPARDWDYAAAGGCTTTSAFKRQTSSVRRVRDVTVESFTGDTAVFIDYAGYTP